MSRNGTQSANWLFVTTFVLVSSLAPHVALGQLSNATVSPFLRIRVRDIAYDHKRNVIYATCGDDAPTAYRHSLVTLTAATLEVIDVLPVGMDPRRLRISDNCRRLYIGVDGAGGMRYYDLAQRKLGPIVPLFDPFSEPARALYFAVTPESSLKFVVGVGPTYSTSPTLEVHDRDQRLSKLRTELGPTEFHFLDSSTLIGVYPDYHLYKYQYDGTKLTKTGEYSSYGLGWNLAFCRGLIYTTSGDIFEPATMTKAGELPGSFNYDSLLVTSEADNTALVLNYEELRLYNLQTRAVTDTVNLFYYFAEDAGKKMVYGGNNRLVVLTGQGAVCTISNVPLAEILPKTLSLEGTAGNDQIQFDPTEGLLTINGVTQDVSSFDRVRINCRAGTDQVFSYDLEAAQDLAYLSRGRIQVDNDSLLFDAIACEESKFIGSDSSDTAVLYDTPANDTIIAKPGMSGMLTHSGVMAAENTAQVLIYTSGGYDDATLSGSSGDDILNGSLKTGNFRLFNPTCSITIVKADFLSINASSGFDIASLVDSDGNDYFIANGNYTRFASSAYDVRTRNFEFLTAHASNSGQDRAELVRRPEDTVSQDGNNYTLRSSSYRYNIRDFENVRVRDN